MIIFAALLFINKKVKIMDAIIAYIIEKWPVLLLVIVTGFVVWLVTRWYFCRFVKVEEKANKIDNLQCSKNEELLSKIDAKLEDKSNKINNLPCLRHEEVYNDIKEELVAIRTFLTIKYPAAAPAFSQKSSPRELNEAGRQLFADIEGEKFLNDNGGFLVGCIESKKPKTALDVEESALQVLYDNIDNDMFIGMKNWVYNSPSRKVRIDGIEKDYVITMNDVCFVLSLPLRDRYLDVHPNLKQSQI